MRAISLFSGAGGFEIGFERAGIQTVLQAESDPWCRQVLARHWPDVERMTDVRDVDGQLDLRTRVVAATHAAERHRPSRVDLVYGGFPCQDLSVAGKRAGFRGERSSLWFEFQRVLSELRPRWTVIENVPGLLSICSCAACVLIGRRIRRHNERRKRQKRGGICRCIACVAGTALRRTHRGRDFAHLLFQLEELGYGWAYRVYDARWFGVPQRRRRVFVVGCLGDEARAAQVLAVCESCGGHPAPRQESQEGLAASLTSGSHGAGSNMPGRHKEDDVKLVVAGTLGSVHHGIEAQQAWTNRLVVARALTAPNGPSRGGSYRLDDQENIVVAQNGSDIQVSDHFGAVSASYARQTSGDLIALETMGVRRLTPLECNRLQGFPDDWDRWAADGREIPDSHRYRMMGNAVCVPVAEWIGHRLVAVDGMREAYAERCSNG